MQLPAWLLYAGGVFWTLGYDTLYAHQDKTDDAKIGVKSTALRLGQSTPLAVRGFYLLAVLFWAAAGWAAGAKPLFFALILVAQYHLLRQVCRADLSNPASCRKAFVSNAQLGAIVLAACILAFF